MTDRTILPTILLLLASPGISFAQDHDKPPIIYEQPDLFDDVDASLERLIAGSPVDESADPAAIYERRVLPIAKSESSSCTECHLPGVSVQQYILPDQAKTFAALRRDGLIDVDSPDKSKLLHFIAQRPKSAGELQDKVRLAEFQAFRNWIHAAAKDPSLLEAATEVVIGTELSDEVIRHARRDRIVGSFVDNVWTQMGRCIHCHSPDKNQRLVKKHGDQVSWIVPNDPAGTLDLLVESGNIDIDSPADSPVLTKPAGVTEHGGGPKFLVGGHTWKRMLIFLEDYAKAAKTGYKTAADLPQPQDELLLLSRQFLRINGIPESLHRLPMKVDLYRWNPGTKSWSDRRWATAFGPIAGKRHFWIQNMTLVAPTATARAEHLRTHTLLPQGAYLAKLYLDRDKVTERHPDYELGEKEFVGQVEVKGRWTIGFKTPKIVEAPEMLRQWAD